MKALLIIALCSVAITAVAQPARLDPRDGAVLPAAAAKKLLHQCSRDSPHSVVGFWSPSPQQIKELETRLPAEIENFAHQSGSDYGQPPEFMRQYAGLITPGKKIIYVNAFPKGMIEEEARLMPGRPAFDWRNDAELVCDGGHQFFGVEYDARRKNFSRFAFNGAI